MVRCETLSLLLKRRPEFEQRDHRKPRWRDSSKAHVEPNIERRLLQSREAFDEAAMLGIERDEFGSLRQPELREVESRCDGAAHKGK